MVQPTVVSIVRTFVHTDNMQFLGPRAASAGFAEMICTKCAFSVFRGLIVDGTDLLLRFRKNIVTCTLLLGKLLGQEQLV